MGDIRVHEKKQYKLTAGDKIIYDVETPNGWSIVIMPDNILIDNYHIGMAHIHPDPKNHSFKIKLKYDNPEEIKEKIFDYLNICGNFDVDELVEMLK